MVLYNFENDYKRDEDGNPVLKKNNRAISRWFVNHINDSSEYLFDVDDESSVGTKSDIEITRPKARTVAAPGFELIVFLISLVAALIIFKYRKKDRRN